MSLRIGIDLDGVVADFASAFHDVEHRLFGPDSEMRPDPPEQEEAIQSARESAARETSQESRLASLRDSRRRRDAIWRVIEATENFWETLDPIDPSAVARIHAAMLEHQWEVFFITQRPRTAGDTVQRQSQRWLVGQGFDLPSVLVIGGSRGAAAGALRLDYHVDDSPQNCLDVIADSRARALLIVPGEDGMAVESARKLGIGTAPSIGAALGILEQASRARAQPGLLARLATMVGWK